MRVVVVDREDRAIESYIANRRVWLERWRLTEPVHIHYQPLLAPFTRVSLRSTGRNVGSRHRTTQQTARHRTFE